MFQDLRLKRYLLLVVLVVSLSAVFHGLWLLDLIPWSIGYSDVMAFWNRASVPGFPYIDKLMEYSVLTGVFVQLAGALGTQPGYYTFSVIFLILASAAATYFLYQINPANRNRILSFWIFAPSLILFSTHNWDIFAVLFSILAFYFFNKGNKNLAAVFLALGFSAKFFPVIYLAPLLLKEENWKNRWKILGVFLAAVLLVNGYFMIANFDGWSQFFRINSERNSNMESIWTVARYLIPPLSVKGINILSFLFFAGSYLAVLWKLRSASLLTLSAVGTLLFLIFNKIFSAQYLIWLLPFLVLLPFRANKFWFYSMEFSNWIVVFMSLQWWFIARDNFYFFASMPFIFLRHLGLLIILFSIIKWAKLSDRSRKY